MPDEDEVALRVWGRGGVGVGWSSQVLLEMSRSVQLAGAMCKSPPRLEGSG